MGGTTVWCHNGSGIESPVAAALGHMNAYNLADGLEANYDRYYRLLNCGLRIPASSGTDWWIYDHNRVFVQVEGSFTYESWIAGLRAGRTFVSNGPLLELRVNGQGPGASVKTAGTLQVSANVVSRLPFERVQIVYNGEVIGEQSAWKTTAKRSWSASFRWTAEGGSRLASRVAARHTPASPYLLIPARFTCVSTAHLTVALRQQAPLSMRSKIPSGPFVSITRLPRMPIARLQSGASRKAARCSPK